MRKIIITLCGLGLGVLSLTAQDRQDIVPPLAGWSYFGGDEFNGNAIDRNLWGLYGDKKKDYSNETYGNNIGQGMAQTYRDKMVTVQDGKASVRATREPIYTGLRYQKELTPVQRCALRWHLPIILRRMVGGQDFCQVGMQTMEGLIIRSILVLR